MSNPLARAIILQAMRDRIVDLMSLGHQIGIEVTVILAPPGVLGDDNRTECYAATDAERVLETLTYGVQRTTALLSETAHEATHMLDDLLKQKPKGSA
jgi:hypothetical protein